MTTQIENALVQFEYKEVETSELAKFIGFNDDELKMLKIFWDPVFNKSWIYLSSSMITKDMGYSKLSNFYSQVLRANYTENVEYKEVTETDPIVQSYREFEEKCQCLLISIGNKAHTGGKTPKYYLVTGRALKKMLMKAKTSRGDAICDYYLKVEELAMFMREYIHALHKYISTKQIDDMTTRVNDLKIINERVQNFIDNTKSLEKKSTFYIATSKRYAAQNIFKPGHIDGVGDKLLTQRLASYNTGKTGDDLFYFCHVEEVYDAKELDHKLKKLFINMKMNKRKEMVICHWDDFLDIVKYVSANHTEDYNYFNDFITSGKFQTTFKKTPVVPPPISFGHTLTIKEHKGGREIKTQTIDVANLTDDQKKEYLIRAIEIFCTNNKMEYNHETEKDNADKKITLVWKDIQSILKQVCRVKKLLPNKWRASLKEINTDSQSIRQIKWINK